MDEKFADLIFQWFYSEKKVLEHQVLVLKGWKIRISTFQLFLSRDKGLGAPRVGAEQPMDTAHQLRKQNLVFENQKMVFINQMKTAS